MQSYFYRSGNSAILRAMFHVLFSSRELLLTYLLEVEIVDALWLQRAPPLDQLVAISLAALQQA